MKKNYFHYTTDIYFRQHDAPIRNGMAKSIQLESNAKLIYTTSNASVQVQNA